MLAQVFRSCGVQDAHVERNEYGKPYLLSGELFFNLSHSGGVIACAVAEVEVGVDVEKICMKRNVMRHAFTDEEKALVKTPEDFTRIWVIKEAYVKMLGEGIGYGLKNVNALEIANVKVERYRDYLVAICYNR